MIVGCEPRLVNQCWECGESIFIRTSYQIIKWGKSGEFWFRIRKKTHWFLNSGHFARFSMLSDQWSSLIGEHLIRLICAKSLVA